MSIARRFTRQTASYWRQFRTVAANEYRTIFGDAGVLL